jgi:TolB-like protein
MADIFLSYSRDDQATAKRYAEAFEREGLSVWWDQTLRPGEAYDRVTEKALADARAVVVLWSRKSVDSHWVRSEATQAQSNGTLVPVMIEACKRPIMFELTQTADLSSWKGETNDKSWTAFVSSVLQFVRRDSSAMPSPAPSPSGTSRPRVAPNVITIAFALVAISAIALWAVYRTRTPEVVAAAAPAAMQEVTLAVLPFVNLSSDKEQEYFSDGLTEEILNQLAQIKDLRVTARTSSFSFKGKNEDVRVIGEKLGVANLLEGSIRKDGSKLRITAQLVNGKDGAHLWSKTYDRELSSVFALQEEVAKDVAQALSIRLDVGDMSRAQGGTTNVEAYDRYLRARTIFYQLGPAELLQSIQLYREAVTLDPGFARAWSGMYGALTLVLTFIPEKSAAALKEMAEASAHIESLAPNAWWTQTMRANRFALQHKWSDAEAASSAALASAPASDVDAMRSRGEFLTDVGRARDAVEYYSRARQVDPLSLSASGFLQLTLDLANRPTEAQAEYIRSKDLAGNHSIWNWGALKRLWLRKGATLAEIEEQFELLLQTEALPMTLPHIVARDPGNREAALVAIRQAFNDPANQDPTRISAVAEYADHYGEPDIALAATRRALIDLNGGIFPMLWRPAGAGMRSDPRFKDLLRDLGLVDYFRSTGNWGDFCKPIGKDDFECH